MEQFKKLFQATDMTVEKNRCIYNSDVTWKYCTTVV